jgi:hypothetical protein
MPPRPGDSLINGRSRRGNVPFNATPANGEVGSSPAARLLREERQDRRANPAFRAVGVNRRGGWEADALPVAIFRK